MILENDDVVVLVRLDTDEYLTGVVADGVTTRHFTTAFNNGNQVTSPSGSFSCVGYGYRDRNHPNVNNNYRYERLL